MTKSSISLGWSPVGFWLKKQLPWQCQEGQQVADSRPSESRSGFWGGLSWSLCCRHKLFRFRFRWPFETSPYFHSAILSFQQTRHIICRWRSGWAEFRSAFWWLYPCLSAGIIYRWYSPAASSCLDRSKSTGGLRTDDCDHGQVDVEIDFRFADDFLRKSRRTCKSEMMGMSLSIDKLWLNIEQSQLTIRNPIAYWFN